LFALVQLAKEARRQHDRTIAQFQRELAAMGYKFQFITLAGFHALNYSMFSLAQGFKERGMSAYADLQEAEFAAEARRYTATRHQREVGTGYFDEVSVIISGRRVIDDCLTWFNPRTNSLINRCVRKRQATRLMTEPNLKTNNTGVLN
jgi:Isocitrate lyase family